ncbi:MFS transporter [Candidatus Bathyarchaeota archaeon]|nr:MFS transporter [Candidatus Bathyarchaeota archaeon]
MANKVTDLFSGIANIRIFQPFKSRNFGLFFLTTITVSLGNIMMMVSSGWLVLELTDSPLSLGIVWATRSAPNLIWGMLAGVVADRVDRKKLQIVALALYSACGFLLGYLVLRGWTQLWHVLLITFVWGSIRAFEGPARQAFIVDIVGREGAMSGISLNAVGLRGIGIIGGAAAGIIIHLFGLEWPFFVITAANILAIGITAYIRGIEERAVVKTQSLWSDLVEGIQIVRNNRVILALMVMAATCEMFGFSYSVLLPVFARDILDVGAVGLGMFSAVRSVGGLIAGLILASLGDYKYKGRIQLGLFLAFGVSLILFANSSLYPLSLFFIGIVGITAAGHDAMQHILFQLNVTEEQRGRAMGIWQLSIGFGVLGSVALGALAETLGASLAQSVYGAVMVIIFVILVLIVPKLRNL